MPADHYPTRPSHAPECAPLAPGTFLTLGDLQATDLPPACDETTYDPRRLAGVARHVDACNGTNSLGGDFLDEFTDRALARAAVDANVVLGGEHDPALILFDQTRRSALSQGPLGAVLLAEALREPRQLLPVVTTDRTSLRVPEELPPLEDHVKALGMLTRTRDWLQGELESAQDPDEYDRLARHIENIMIDILRVRPQAEAAERNRAAARLIHIAATEVDEPVDANTPDGFQIAFDRAMALVEAEMRELSGTIQELEQSLDLNGPEQERIAQLNRELDFIAAHKHCLLEFVQQDQPGAPAANSDEILMRVHDGLTRF